MEQYYKLLERRKECDDRYLQGKIYMINVDGELYVGSTIEPLDTRFTGHIKGNENRSRPQSKLYEAIRKRSGWEGLEMELLENYPCQNKFLLGIRETKWMNMLNSTLNIKKAYSYFNQYYWEHKEKIANYKKDYAKKNALREAERKHTWYEQNKERILTESKLRYEANKDILNAEQRRKYIPKPKPSQEQIELQKQATKERAKAKARQRVECPSCGKNLSKDSLRRHNCQFKEDEITSNPISNA